MSVYHQEEEQCTSLQNSVNLNDGDLSEKAKVNFKFFGDILRAFKLLSDGVLANKELSPIGRHIICSTIERDHFIRILQHQVTEKNRSRELVNRRTFQRHMRRVQFFKLQTST
jgi:hypothetical protein